MAEPAPDESLQYAPGQVTPSPPGPPPAESPESAAPPLEEVTLGGRTFQVSPDVAAMVAAQQDQITQYQTQNDELQRRVSDLDAWRQNAAQVFTGGQQSGQPDYGQLLYTDPNAFVSSFRDDIRNDVINSVRTMYQEDQTQRGNQDAMRRFMDGFYQDHEDLRGMDTVVNATLQTNMANWATLPLSEVGPKLAEASRAEALRMVQRFSGARPNLRIVEGGSGAPPGVASDGDEIVDGNSVPLGSIADDVRAMRGKRKAR